MHHMVRAADVGLVPDQVGQASQYWRCALVDRSIGYARLTSKLWMLLLLMIVLFR